MRILCIAEMTLRRRKKTAYITTYTATGNDDKDITYYYGWDFDAMSFFYRVTEPVVPVSVGGKSILGGILNTHYNNNIFYFSFFRRILL